MMHRLACALVFCALLLVRNAESATYYVATIGSDANAGTQAAPWKTIQKATTKLIPGDTVLIANGTYAGGITQSKSGTAASPITFKAANSGQVTVAGNQTTQTDAILIQYADYVVVDGLTVKTANRAGIRVDNSNHVTIRNCKLTSNKRWGLFTDYSDDLLIENNECSFSGTEHGIYVSNSGDRPVVRYNLLHDNYLAGLQINADPSMIDPTLGLRGDGITQDGVVEGNVIYNNGAGGAAGINLASVRTSLIVNNLIYNNKAGGIAGWDDGDGTQWGSKNNTIVHNTVYFQPGIGRWCVSLKNGSVGNAVQNNILNGGARAALEVDSTSSVVSDYNLLRSIGSYGVATNPTLSKFYTLSQWQTLTGGDQNSINADPLFVSSSTAPFDFHVQSTSPTIDKGADRTDVPFDASGNPRPVNARWDLGCYESGSSAVQPALSALALNPTSLTGGANSTGTVTLTAAAPAGGIVVTLLSGNTVVVGVPASVTVQAGAASATFQATTSVVTAAITIPVSATYNGVTKSANLTVQPAATSQTLYPTADSYVRAGTYTGTNFGTATVLAVDTATKNSTSAYNRCAYLQFDLTGVTAAPVSATLTLTINSASFPYGSTESVSLYHVPAAVWIESGITWNNAPGFDPLTFNSTGILLATKGVKLATGTVSFDLTALVAANLGKTITLQLIDTSAENLCLYVNSREAASGKPVLQIGF